MRCLPGRRRSPSGHLPEHSFESISPTPVPALLHVCRETRTLALAHYEITFGHPEAPTLPPRRTFESSCDGCETDASSVTRNQDPALARCGPKIYINFEHDTVLFGRAFLPLGESTIRMCMFSKSHAHFPSKEEFEPGQLTRIETLGLSFFPGGEHISFPYLDYRVRSGEFPKLRNLYLCLQTSDPDFSQGMDLVRLENCTEKNEDGVTRVQEFLSRCKSRMLLPDYNLRWLETGEALRAMSRLDKHPHLRDLLLRNGADPDEPLKIVWAKEIKKCGQKENELSVTEAMDSFRPRRPRLDQSNASLLQIWLP